MREESSLFKSQMSKVCILITFQIVCIAFLSSSARASISTFTSDGAWCWFGDPRAIYYEGEKEQTYIGWVTKDGSIMVSSYNHVTGVQEEKMLHANLQADDHNSPSIFFRKDGRLIVLYSAHSSGPMYSVISDEPEDISSFSSPVTFGEDVTYPNPFQVGNSIYVFYRGINWHPTLIISNDNGNSWGSPQQLIRGGGSRPYAKYSMDDQEGIHIAFTTGHPRDESSNKIFYTYFKDGSFRRADGTVVKRFTGSASALNIDTGEAEVVYNASNGRGWIWDVAFDEANRPVIVYTAYRSNTDHRYYYAGWNGVSWNNYYISSGGSWFPQTPPGATEPEPNYSGGIAVDYDDTSVVYLSKPVNGVFEIFKYTTRNQGQSWSSSQITQNTPYGTLNVRPFVPVNHKPGYFDVVWMRGSYVFYQNYNTSIMHLNTNSSDEISDYYKFDFGTGTSPLRRDSIRVSESTRLSGSYGWIDNSGISSRDRSSSTDDKRDFVFASSSKQFQVNIPNGAYRVTTVQGDVSYPHDDMFIYANDELKVSGVTTAAGQLVINRFRVDVTNGQIVFEFGDNSGFDENWVINNLIIESLDGNGQPGQYPEINSYSSAQSGNGPERILDGNMEDTSRWSAAGFPQWVIIDYGENISVSETQVFTYQDRAYQYYIYGSTNLADVQNEVFSALLVDNSENTSTNQPITNYFPPVVVRYIKLKIIGASGYTGTWSSINGLEVW